MNNEEKLNTLAQIEGLGVMAMLEKATFDGIAKGICVHPGCDYTTDVEPDMDAGYCEVCGNQTVKSCLVIAGVM